MTDDSVRDLTLVPLVPLVLRTALRHHGTVERTATTGLARGCWRHFRPAERATLAPYGPGDLRAALQRSQEGAPS